MTDTRNRMVQQAAEIDKKDHDQYELGETQHVDLSTPGLSSDEEEVEPELHARTWITLAAFFLLNYTQVVALQGPAAVVSMSNIPRMMRSLDNFIAELHWNGPPQH